MKSFFFAWFSALIVSTGRAVASEKGMPQLDPEFWAAQIFWLILIFSILYIIIWKIFLPRIVVGVESPKAEKILKELYEPFIRREDRLICVDIQSSEISKYASNAMLATRISFINEIANLCEKLVQILVA